MLPAELAGTCETSVKLARSWRQMEIFGLITQSIVISWNIPIKVNENNFISRNHPFLDTYIGDSGDFYGDFRAVISGQVNWIFRLITHSIVISWNILINFDEKQLYFKESPIFGHLHWWFRWFQRGGFSADKWNFPFNYTISYNILKYTNWIWWNTTLFQEITHFWAPTLVISVIFTVISVYRITPIWQLLARLLPSWKNLIVRATCLNMYGRNHIT